MKIASRARRLLLSSLVAGVLLFAAAPASAQSGSGSGGLFAATSIGAVLTTYVGIPATTVGGGITVVIVLVNSANDSKDAESYLYTQSDALKQDLTVGDGRTIRELAEIFDVESSDYPAFANLVHDRRKALVPLTNRSKLDEQRARSFFRTIARGMRQHPELRDDLRTASSIPAQH